MRKRAFILLVVLAMTGVASAWAVVFRPFEEGPRYRGLPVSFWRKSLIEWSNSRGGPPSARIRLETLLGLSRNGGQPSILGDDPAVQPVLLQLIRDEDNTVNAQARRALNGLPANKALWHAIVALLRDDDPRIRTMGEALLRSFGDWPNKEVLAVLGELLQSEELNKRTDGLNIVLRLGPDAAPVVPEVAEMLHARWPLRYYSALALRRVGPHARAAIPDLVSMLQDEDELCRHAAAQALRHIDPDAITRRLISEKEVRP